MSICEPLIFAATSDLAGKVRGKAFPAANIDKRAKHGVGWVPTNSLITCFDTIAEGPFGSLGDLLLVPDQDAHVYVDFEDGLPPDNFMLSDILTLQGAPWECCPRSILKEALAKLERVSGLKLNAAFEHEFHLRGSSRPIGDAFSLDGLRMQAKFAETVMAAINASGIKADTIINEYGADQLEITVAPEVGVRSADAAVAVRELVRSTAQRLSTSASFTPIRDPAGVGNGVHIHISFIDSNNTPVTYDPAGKHGLSATAGSFIAGVLKYLPSIVALSAPSAISYHRLTPHRWSAAYNNLGMNDREAAVRICPTTSKDSDSIAKQFNFEYRAADAAASPYLALAGIVNAGVQGIADAMETPEATHEDLSLLSDNDLISRGYSRLPQSLTEALDSFSDNVVVKGWFSGKFGEVYRCHKLGELDFVKDMDLQEQCAIYEQTY